MENLKAAARLDVLTNVGNRRAIYESIEDAIADYQHDGKPFTVVTFDLNKFKLINDEFGHQIGDKVLKAIATYFKRKIKGVDFIGRLGGDEFLLILKNTAENQAENLMQTFIFGFSEDSVLTKYQIKISYGISEVCGKKCNYNSLIKSAYLKMMNKKKI